MDDKDVILREACCYFDFKWPVNLWTGVMFFKGSRITVEEFDSVSREMEVTHNHDVAIRRCLR